MSLLNCVAAIDSKHVAISKRASSGSLHYRYKVFFQHNLTGYCRLTLQVRVMWPFFKSYLAYGNELLRTQRILANNSNRSSHLVTHSH